MADTVTVQTLADTTGVKFVAKLTNLSDGTGENLVKKITNITKAHQFEKDDIVLFYSMEQNEILKIKNFLSKSSYSFPAIIFGSFEEVSTLEKNSFIFFDTPFNFFELLKNIENIILQRD